MIALNKMNDMRGRRALVTGAAGHLGRVIADVLAELGTSLILLDRPGSELLSVEAKLTTDWGIECLSFECDLEDEKDREKVINQIKESGNNLNCLVNNAAFVGAADLSGWAVPFEEQSLSTWRRALEVNLVAPFHLSQAFAQNLRASKGGNIVNIGSIYGELGPDWSMYDGTNMGNPAAYAASKAGLAQLTRWLATTLAPTVRVNCIAPGGIYRNQPSPFAERYSRKTPMGRMASEQDIRGAISFLASDLSEYVTGEILRVDGGWGIW